MSVKKVKVFNNVRLKPPEHSLGIKMEQKSKVSQKSKWLRDKRINIRYDVTVLKKSVHKSGPFPIHQLIWGETIFLSIGQKKDLP